MGLTVAQLIEQLGELPDYYPVTVFVPGQYGDGLGTHHELEAVELATGSAVVVVRL